jgi:Holliday junction resolvase RusA-like endonuclease
MTISRTGSDPFPVLEDNLGFIVDLVTVKTGSEYRKEVISTIRLNLESWMRNHYFEKIREDELDLAIIACVNPGRMKNQDIDNISKVVLDALKKSEDDDRFLFYDDCQVTRLLIWKIQQEELADNNAYTLTISFRIHDPQKQMILIEPEKM